MGFNNGLSKSERGFSLVEVLVSLGLLGGIATIVALLSNQVNKNQNTMEVKLDTQVFSAGFSAYLMSEPACSALISKTPPSSTSSPLNITVQGFSGFGVNPNQVLAAGTAISKNLKLDELTLKTKPGVTPLNTTINGVLLKKSIVQVNYTLKASNVAQKDEIVTHAVDIPVLLNAAGSIMNCTGVSTLSSQDMCEMMNMAYNATTGRCDPVNTCEVLGTFSTLSCIPAGYSCEWSTPSADSVNPITGGKNCPAGSTPSVTSQFSHNVDVTTGKKSTQTVTNTELYYVCLKCL